MELYDKEYFTALKERIKVADKKPIATGFIYLAISIIFFFIWSNIVLDNPFLILIPFEIYIILGLAIPFVLLYLILKKEDSKSLLIVIGIMSSSLYFELFDLAYFYTIYLVDPLRMDSDLCPICEIKDSIPLILMSLSSLVLIAKNKIINTKFNLTKKNILLAMLIPLPILLLKIVLFFS